MRAKRSSHLNGQLYTGPGMLLLRVDETASKLNHFSLEIPLLIEYCLINRPLSFQLGLRARDWQATDLKGDILKSRKEIGVAGGIFHNLNKKLAVGFDWYSSLTKLYNGAIYDTSGNLIAAFSLRNQSILGTLEYRIGK